MKVAAAVVDFSLTREVGLGLVRRLRCRFPELNLIVLSVHNEPNVSRAVLEAGANGFVLKSCIVTDLLPAVDTVLSGKKYVSPKAMQPSNPEDGP
jgi:DNA-binding NarL/FixJ family response regulator